MMSEQPAVPFLTEEAIHHAMESLRQARPLGDSPLRRLVWVWEQLNRRQPTFSSVEFDVTLGEALASLIEERLAHHRAVEGIPAEPATNREAALNRLREDFTRDNAELEAWSILYHRYIRLELNLRVQDLAHALNVTTPQAARDDLA